MDTAMRSTCTWSAAVGGLVLLCLPAIAGAQIARVQPVMHVASLAPGAILGNVQDERGAPVAGAIVSALGTTTVVAVSDRTGRFELRTLTPGPYLLRAHLSGYVASRGQVVEVRSSSRAVSSISLRRANGSANGELPALAGVGLAPTEPVAVPGDGVGTSGTDSTAIDNHGEVAWRLRHTRRGILKDADIPDEILVGDTPPDANVFGNGSLMNYVGSSARLASNLFSTTPF